MQTTDEMLVQSQAAEQCLALLLYKGCAGCATHACVRKHKLAGRSLQTATASSHTPFATANFLSSTYVSAAGEVETAHSSVCGADQLGCV